MLDSSGFEARVRSTASISALSDLLERAIEPLGLTVFAVGQLPAGGAGGAMFMTNWPVAWLERYVADNLAAEDIMVHDALVTPHAFTWREARERRPGQAARAFAAAAEFGWHEGFVVPVHGPGEVRGLAAFAGPTLRLAEADRPRVTAMILLVYRQAEVLFLNRGKSHVLTGRERNALSLVAEGKDDAEIAQIMKISRTTAHSHVERAKRRLGATTRAQAVAIAITQKLL